MKEWYGDNCLRKWNGTCYVETLPVERRVSKHLKNVSLESDECD